MQLRSQPGVPKMSKACVRFALLSAFVVMGCGATSGSGADDPFAPSKPGSGKGGASGSGSGSGSGFFLDELKPSTMPGQGSGDDNICAQQDFPLDRLPPEIMVVLDRSGSMRRNAQGGREPPDKWGQTVAALDSVLSDTQGGVYWGLKMYPSWKREGDSPCAIQGLQQAPGLDQHAALMAQINGNGPTLDKGATPTAAAVQESTGFLSGRSTPNPKFLLLATDGVPNCRDGSDRNGDVDGSIAAIGAAREAGFAVFVVGIAASGIRVDNVDAFQVLNDMAEAGGRPQDGQTKFFPANNEAELKTALNSIASQAADCTFNLNKAPPDPSNVRVELNDERLTQGTDWEFGAGNRSVVVKGAWCEKLKKSNVEKAEIKFGCPGMVIL